ncbi:MAG: VIT1/CCC1 transporter family protein [bacterium]|nr:VIT1/CCC1 transporter family protein [bacterium]
MENLTREQYDAHLEREHSSSPLTDYLKEIVYGGNDGIVTTFAVVAGFTGASVGVHSIPQLSVMTVILFGLANLFADGAAMGLGNFLSVRAEKNVYQIHKDKEAHEVVHSKEMEMAETRYLLEDKGFTSEQATQLTDIFATNPAYWVEFMMQYELELPNPEGENPVLNGLATFASFVVFGFIPLLPYFFMGGRDTQSTFIYSCMATFGALVLLGLTSAYASGRDRVLSLLETVAVGTVSASVAFFVGTLF